MEKKVIIVNGKNDVGKDALIDIAGKEFKVLNVSSVDPIKMAATFLGWDSVKDDRGRQFLIELKEAAVRYGDLPTEHMVDQYEFFLEKKEYHIMFIHIREPKEIEKLVKRIPAKTLLITRKMENVHDHKKDDEVCDFKYDYTFANDKPLEESGKDFIKLLQSIK